MTYVFVYYLPLTLFVQYFGILVANLLLFYLILIVQKHITISTFIQRGESSIPRTYILQAFIPINT